jgi:signal peptidase I
VNIALILVIITTISGLVILYEKISNVIRRSQKKPLIKSEGIVSEYSHAFFPILLVVLIVRSFIFEPFRIPSGSMIPTLQVGDFIIVKKYPYGLRIPVLETKFIEIGKPKRGDVAVFRLPSDPKINYIKRVIGLPGDRIVYRNHHLLINDQSIPLTKINNLSRYTEVIDDHEYSIQILYPRNVMGDGIYIIPEDSYFMMGDNRDNSKDSRFIESIPESYLVGEAVRIWMHMDGLEIPDWSRIGIKIK